MKQLLYCLVPALCVLIACQDTPQFQVDKTRITVEGSIGINDTIAIQSEVDWNASTSADWLQLFPLNAVGKSDWLIVKTKKLNSSDATRTATILITPVGTSSVQQVTLTVNQKPAILPTTSWSKTYSGIGHSYAHSIATTADGGFMMAGVTQTNSYHGSEDAWVMKLNGNGDKLWYKTFRGTDPDEFYSIAATPDGGYIVAGETRSNDGDFISHHGGDENWIRNGDAWIMKLDSNGNTKWSKTYGGTGNDYAYSIVVTPDGSYVVAGSTDSNNGDVSGNHGYTDAWVMKLDAKGNMLWSKAYGGVDNDIAHSIATTPDGGFIMAGDTKSNNGDVSGNHGYTDAWVMKLDAKGNMLWSKAYGGPSSDQAYSIATTVDGGLVVAGSTRSDNVDVSNHHGMVDAWIIKLDSNGNTKWSKAYGGTVNDYAHSIAATPDGGYIVAGETRSNDGNFSGNHGANDAWVMKLDAKGDMVWCKAYGGTGNDHAESIAVTAYGDFIMAGNSNSMDGDLLNNSGNIDIWVLKLKSKN